MLIWLQKKNAISWLDDEQLPQYLTRRERDFLFESKGLAHEFRIQIEAMWALAWVLNLVDRLDFWLKCDNNFVYRMPDLKNRESSEKLRASARLRSQVEIRGALDLAYCLHWAIRQADMDQKQLPG